MIRATVHPACHYYKIVAEDASRDPDVALSESSGKGMFDLVLTAAVPVVTECGYDLYAEVPLALFIVKRLEEEGTVYLGLGGNLFDCRRQVRFTDNALFVGMNASRRLGIRLALVMPRLN